MAKQRKKNLHKISIIEACLSNFYLIFMLGLFLGFGMAILMLSPYKAAGVLKNYLPVYSSR